jgi:hypothetical protein
LDAQHTPSVERDAAAPDVNAPFSAADLDALEKIALAATPGAWTHMSFQSGTECVQFGNTLPGRGYGMAYRAAHITYFDIQSLGLSEGDAEKGKWSDAAHITAFQPSTVLRLIAAARATQVAA